MSHHENEGRLPLPGFSTKKHIAKFHYRAGYSLLRGLGGVWREAVISKSAGGIGVAIGSWVAHGFQLLTMHLKRSCCCFVVAWGCQLGLR